MTGRSPTRDQTPLLPGRRATKAAQIRSVINLVKGGFQKSDIPLCVLENIQSTVFCPHLLFTSPQQNSVCPSVNQCTCRQSVTRDLFLNRTKDRYDNIDERSIRNFVLRPLTLLKHSTTHCRAYLFSKKKAGST